MSLGSDQQQFITTAQGYVDLGMHLEANDELEKMDALVRHLPEVLQVRLQIYEKLKKWELMQAVAKKLAEYDPGNVQAWISWAYATRRAESIEAGRTILLNALENHVGDATIHFNLACYESQLGDVENARRHLAICFAIDPGMRLMALEDRDLQTLWDSL